MADREQRDTYNAHSTSKGEGSMYMFADCVAKRIGAAAKENDPKHVPLYREQMYVAEK